MPDYFSPYGRALTSGYPTRVISGTDILELGSEQQQTLIGHTLTYCNELESALNEAVSKAEGYYSRLVELGDIVPPKTPEELVREQAAAQQEINAKLLETVQALTQKIEKLEVNGDGLNSNGADAGEGVQPKTSRPGAKRNAEVPSQ